jgi:hypothetical protein
MKREERSKILGVRLSLGEWAAVKKQADELGFSVSDFVRVRILVGTKEDKKEHRGRNKKEYREVAEQVARVGNNLNQLAKWVNTYKSEADAARVIVFFSAALTELKRIRAGIIGE